MRSPEIQFAAQAECDRQRVGPERVGMLLDGYEQAWVASRAGGLPTLEDVMGLAVVVEPPSYGRFHLVPVLFDDGGSAASVDVVPSATARMFELLDERTDPDEFIRSFLSVHPFLDGNGRVAWVLRNWLTRTWFAPEPLPTYRW